MFYDYSMGVLSKIQRFYFFHGDDEYTKMNKVKSLVATVIDKSFMDFDYSYFEGRGLDASLAINTASSPPFGSPLRVVVIRNFEKVSIKGQELILKFIDSIPDYATVVLTSGKLEGADKRKKIFKALLNNKQACVEFSEPMPDKAVVVMTGLAKEMKMHISQSAVEYLVETVGCNLGILEQEMRKLSIYAGADEEITEATVAQLIGAGTIGTIFDLPIRMASKDIEGALRLLHRLLLTKESEGTILFRIKDFFLKLNMTKTASASSFILMKKYRLSKKVSDILVDLAPGLSFDCIINCLHYIYESEISLKSAGINKEIILYDLVSRVGAEISGE